MQIRNHKLTEATFRQARHIGGTISPEIVILHDTASRLDHGSAANYLRDNTAKVSVHFVVERDGSIEQQVPVNRRANHAGQSAFQGREGCNEFSLGIEIVNPGRLTRASASKAVTWYGQEFDIAEYGIREMETREHGAGLWMPYTEAQITSVLALLEVLFRDLRSLKDITTHWYVSPGRKVDPNPLFPLREVRARILGRHDPAEAAAVAASQPVIATAANPQLVEVETPGDSLNLRRWPSFNPNILTAIPDGTVVPVLRKGLFDGRLWLRVAYGGFEGWIVAAHAAPITFSQAS